MVNGVGIRFFNYALYCGAIAAGVLIMLDLPQPTDYAAEGYRVLWTFCGVATGALVMLLAGLLAKRRAKAPPQPAPQPACTHCAGSFAPCRFARERLLHVSVCRPHSDHRIYTPFEGMCAPARPYRI